MTKQYDVTYCLQFVGRMTWVGNTSYEPVYTWDESPLRERCEATTVNELIGCRFFPVAQ